MYKLTTKPLYGTSIYYVIPTRWADDSKRNFSYVDVECPDGDTSVLNIDSVFATYYVDQI